jgi:chemotaxis protein methyltransferase CheR
MSSLPAPGPDDLPKLRPQEFELVRRMVYDHCGVELRGKEVLVAARLVKEMRELGLHPFKKYYEYVRRDATGEALTEMVDALTTNHTSFFREPRHFDFLRKVVLPGLPASSQVRLWSAACSSGEEPYSIAFSLMEEMGTAAQSRVRVLATDISRRMLEKARQGQYPAPRFEGLPMAMLRKYLLKGEGRSEDLFLVKKEVRDLIEFRHLNLMEDFSSVGTFSVVFCRNVMIYFDQKTQERLVGQLAARLDPGGYLFIGHSESLYGIQHSLQYVCPAIYRKPSAAPRPAGARSGR